MEKGKVSNPIFGYSLSFEDRLDLMGKALSIFALLEKLKFGETKLRERPKEVLAFYLLEGYNSDTKDIICETLEINSDNLTQINSELTKAGYLITDERNLRKKHLNPDLQRLRDLFISDHQLGCKRAFLIRFDGIKK